MGVLLGGWPDGVAARNKVTSSLMAITVIIVGVVNCFFVGPNDGGGCLCNAIREAEGSGGR